MLIFRSTCLLVLSAIITTTYLVHGAIPSADRARIHGYFRNKQYDAAYNRLQAIGATTNHDNVEAFKAFMEPHPIVTSADVGNEALLKWAYDHGLTTVPYYGHTNAWHILYTIQAIVQTFLSILATRYLLAKNDPMTLKLIETAFAILWFLPLLVNKPLIRHNAIKALRSSPPTPPFGGRPLHDAFNEHDHVIQCIGTHHKLSRRLVDACREANIDATFDPCSACSTPSEHVHCNKFSQTRRYECGNCLAPLDWYRSNA